MMNDIKLIIFDLDGTLLDTSKGILKSVKETAEHFGWEQLTDEQYALFIGPPMKRSLIKWFHLNEEDADEATEYFRSVYKNHNLYFARVYDGMIQTLRDLKKNDYLLGVATYKRTDYATDILVHFGMAKYFDLIVGDTAGSLRTKSEIIRLVCEQLCVDPADALMVGDTVGDLSGAREAGVGFVGVTYGFGFTAEDCDCDSLWIEKPADLIHVLKECE